MAALFNNLTIVDDADHVGVTNGAQAMGNDNRGTAVQQCAQGVLDQAFGQAVDIGSGLIQYQDARVGQDGPRNAEQLPLTDREVRGALLQAGVVAAWFGDNKVMGIGLAGGLFDFLVGGIGAAEADIAGDGAGKQERVLRNKANLLVELALFECPDVEAIN